MTESFDFRDLEFFTVGTLGPRGQRVFYLQARAEGQLVSLKLEKQQVAALADYLDRVLAELPEAPIDPDDGDLGLREPVVAAWTVGSLAIAYAEDLDRLIVVAEELVDPGDSSEPAVDLLDVEEPEPAEARFSLRRDQVAALIIRARDVVAAGRPPCRFCGRPLESRTGDWCACRN